MIQIKCRRLFSLALGAVIGWASRGWVTTAVANTIELAQAVSKLTKIGDIRDLRRSGFGTPPERARAAVSTRDAVYRNEVMETVAGGAMRIRFGDATSLRIGSESLVSLDEYVYAPFKRSKMTLALSKGVFRFVTGKMSKRAYRIVTPTATIGVRGTDFLATVTDVSTVIDLYEGEIEVEDTRGADAPAPVTVAAGQKVTVSTASTTPTIGVASPPSDPALAGDVVDDEDSTGSAAGTEGLGGEGGESGGCFPAGTKVTMADGSMRNIEYIEVDDLVLAFDFDTNQATPARVRELMAPVREGFYVLNDGLLRLTDNHPVFVMRDGREYWASLNPDSTMRETSLDDVQLLEEGDEVLVLDVHALQEITVHEFGLGSQGRLGRGSLTTRFARIETIRYVEGAVQTYNLKSVAGLHNFFADRVLVHNKTD